MLARIAAAAVCAAMICGCSARPSDNVNTQSFLPSAQRAATTTASPIQHVIVVIQENRTPDNLFNGFSGADTVTTGLTKSGNTVMLQPQGLEWQYDPSHTHPSLVTEYDGGKMDGFNLDGCDADPLSLSGGCKPPKNFTYSYVPSSEVEWYWLLAGAFDAVHIGYGFADHMFSSRQVPSFPGHQFLIAGQTPAAGNPFGPGAKGLAAIWGCDAPDSRVYEFGKTYSAALKQGTPCYNYDTIGDLLDDKYITWKYYTGVVGTNDGGISAFDAIMHARYGPQWTNNVSTPMTNVLSDIQNGTLPEVSFVTPPFAASDHGATLSAGGPGWVMSLYVALTENKRLYGSTAMFVVWDDSGGWYDHVKPPNDKFGPLGFRVPLIVVSPYARQRISHNSHTFGSILHYIEKNFGLRSLHTTDESSDDLSDMFDYKQTPIPPIANWGSFNRDAFKRKYTQAYWNKLATDPRSIDTDQ
jgi:phospholipase C